MRKKNYKCLMIEAQGRKFFTHEKHFDQLIEFANVFDAQISVVRMQDGDVLDLAPLAAAISDNSYNINPHFEIIERKIPAGIEKSSSGDQIKDFVKEVFLTGKVVHFHKILDQFKNNVTYAGLSTTLHRVRKELEQSGHSINKIAPGQYKLVAQ